MNPPLSPDATTPGRYLRAQREAAGLSLHDVADRLRSDPYWAEHVRVEWLELVEADEQPVTFGTVVALSLAYSFDFAELVQLAAPTRSAAA